MGTAGHQPQTAAHYDAVTPTDYRLAESVQQIIEAVFAGEEVFGVPVSFALWCINHTLVQANNIATGTECFIAFGIKPDGGDAIVLLPVG